MKEPSQVNVRELSPSASAQDVLAIGVVTVLIWYVVEPWAAATFGRDGTFVGAYLVPRTASACCVVLLACALTRLRKVSSNTIGLRLARLAPQVGIGLLGVPACYLAVIFVNSALLFVEWLSGERPVIESTLEFMGGLRAKPTPELLTILSIGAVFEELLFRGLMLSRLRRAVGGNWIPILVTSGIYACMHFGVGFHYAVVAFGLSVMFGIVFVVGDSLLSATISHLTFNVCQVLVIPTLFA
jgi:membrane protease YdiL (CAAX protease family)